MTVTLIEGHVQNQAPESWGIVKSDRETLSLSYREATKHKAAATIVAAAVTPFICRAGRAQHCSDSKQQPPVQQL